MKLLNFFLLTAILFICTQYLKAQQITPSTLNVCGGYFSQANYYTHLEWSFGEGMSIDTYTTGGNNFLYTSGILQPCTEKVVSETATERLTASDVTIFPNATTGQFEANFNMNQSGKLYLKLYDMSGRLIENRTITYQCCKNIVRFNITNQAAGTYMLTAVFMPDASGQQSKNAGFKIVKY